MSHPLTADAPPKARPLDRKSTRLNSSHEWISYALFCSKKKKRFRAIHLAQDKKRTYEIRSRDIPLCSATLPVNRLIHLFLALPLFRRVFFFFFNDTATTEIYTLSLHDALPISPKWRCMASMSISVVRRKPP